MNTAKRIMSFFASASMICMAIGILYESICYLNNTYFPIIKRLGLLGTGIIITLLCLSMAYMFAIIVRNPDEI